MIARGMTLARTFVLAALGTLLVVTSGCFDPIVGARCAAGYVPCHGRCVATCAATDGPASPTDAAAGSTDVRADLDGSAVRDAATTDGATTTDAAAPDTGDAAGPVTDGAADDGPPATSGDAADAALDAAADAAAPADDTAGADADAGADAASPDAAPPADAPPPIDCGTLVLCPVGCTNLDDDPDNCGSCGFSCGTGLCVGRVCQQRQSGHLVVLGHDYSVTRPAMDNIIGNAVFFAPSNPVKVLAYEGAATAESIGGADSAIQRIAASQSRSWTKTTVSSANVPAMLPSADVFLIYAQAGASDATLMALGTAWSAALNDFVQAGKTLILLEGWSPANAGTFQIVQQANLFHANSRTDVTGQTMFVARPGDAVATRVPQTYRGERGTVWFDTNDQTVVIQVASDAGIQPVVVHAVF